jgi:hypothetical protein
MHMALSLSSLSLSLSAVENGFGFSHKPLGVLFSFLSLLWFELMCQATTEVF